MPKNVRNPPPVHARQPQPGGLLRTAAAQPAPAGLGSISSVDNALRLLLLIDDRQALRVTEAAELLGVARSTAHRLLTALRQRDFVTQDRPNGAYRPGPALRALGLAAISRIDVRRLARPMLEHLHERTNETVTLAILEGRMVRFVDSIESRRSVRVGNRTGIVRLAHASAVGKAMLAELPRRDFDRRYPEESIGGDTPGAITTRTALEAELVRVRDQGYALNWEESLEGVAAVAVAIHDATGAPIASVGVAAPSSRIGGVGALHEFGPVMREVAQRLVRPDS